MQTRARRHHSLQHDSPPSSSHPRLRPAREHARDSDRDRDRDRDRERDSAHAGSTQASASAVHTNPTAGTNSVGGSYGLTAVPPTSASAPRSKIEVANTPRADNLLERARRVFSLPSPNKSRRRSQTPPLPANDSFGAGLPPQAPSVAGEGAGSSKMVTISAEPVQSGVSREATTQSRGQDEGGSCSAIGTGSGRSNITCNRDSTVMDNATRRSSTAGATGVNVGTTGGIASRSARKAARVLSGRTGGSAGQTGIRGADTGGTMGCTPRHGGIDAEGETTDALEVRLRILENELEASRVRMARQRKRIQQLEDESSLSRQALPALETIIKSALAHFDAKEAALKHTITKIHQEMATVVAEKNEALRLLASFVGRSARSPPPSFSSMSEAGAELSGTGARDGRRSGSASSGAGRRSSLMDHSFESSGGAHAHDRAGDAGDSRGGVTTR